MVTQAEALFEAPVAHESRSATSPYAQAETGTHEQADRFVTRVQPIPGLPGHLEGHEILTRGAARALPRPLTAAELRALIIGVITPDRGGASYLSFPKAALTATRPDEQRRHALRRTRATTTRAALVEIRRYLITLHARALRRGRTPAGFHWAGEALHLIQDSYSCAHTERAHGRGPGGTHPIRYVRWFGFSVVPPSRSAAPHEHNYPTDSRDTIAAGGKLKPEALLAQRAGREFLLMLIRHWAAPTSPAIGPDLRRFLRRHLS